MRKELLIHITGQGTQDDRVRLRKRLSCAARGLGLTAQIEEDTGNDGQLSAFLGDDVIIEGLAQTEVIEKRIEEILSQTIASRDSS